MNNEAIKLVLLTFINQARPVKTDQEIIRSSMAEDDPKCISEEDNKSSPHRWGRHHKGAKELANLYSTGEHVINCYKHGSCDCDFLLKVEL